MFEKHASFGFTFHPISVSPSISGQISSDIIVDNFVIVIAELLD